MSTDDPTPVPPSRAAGPPAGDEPTAEAPFDAAGDAEPGRGARVLKFAKRLMDRRDLTEDTKVLLGAVLSTSDKAKTEAVRMMAREFRAYLKELKLKEDLLELATSHSLEVKVSLHLRPLAAEAPTSTSASASPSPSPTPVPRPRTGED